MVRPELTASTTRRAESLHLFAKRTICFLMVAFFVQLPSASAQVTDTFSLTGQIRHRSEYSAKDFNADVDNPFFSLLRTRLGVGVNATSDIQAFVQFQDARTWGGESPGAARGTLDGNAAMLDVHQAYFRVSNVFDTGVSATIGRQEINVGNQRLVGAVGWHNVGRSFDAARLGYVLEQGSLDFFAARLIGSTNTPNGDNLYGAVGTFSLSPSTSAVALVLLDNSSTPVVGGPDQDENTLQRVTTGVLLQGGHEAMEYEVEGYYQLGDQYEVATGKRASIGAYLASGRLAFGIHEAKGLKLGVFYTLVSGDDNPTDGDVKNFDTLFATNHKFYGFMDYFVGSGSFSNGLQDIGLSATVKANNKATLALDLHHFSAPQRPMNLNSALGEEVDFTLNYSYNSALSLVGGMSAFMPTEGFGGDDTAFWGYLSTIVSF